MGKIVELQSVTAGYEDEIILRDVNFTIHDNDFIGVIGPNGGGKTTLVKVIIGLIKPVSGKVIYHRQDETAETRKLIGYLPQVSSTDRVFPITVLNVVLSGLARRNRLVNHFSKTHLAKAREMLEAMGISHLAGKNIGELSGGQLQRAFLCRAIVSDPKLLILDEPNTYVDNKFESDLYKTLKDLNKRMAIMIVSHDVGTITYFVKTIACVNRELHYHESNIISQEQLAAYNCPIQIIAHGDIPHTILKQHNHTH
ncbi:MAG: ABC transporter ATP-binding protein [Bacteroidales bacterium]|nr:ABC transporter ATP-binding protein [Bacteroidales bacterium]